jgi:hypothetical protein
MVRGGNLLILRFVGQRSRSQLLKIEQKLDSFFVSARYLKNEMSDLNESWYTGIVHPCLQLGFRTFGALLIFSLSLI